MNAVRPQSQITAMRNVTLITHAYKHKHTVHSQDSEIMEVLREVEESYSASLELIHVENIPSKRMHDFTNPTCNGLIKGKSEFNNKFNRTFWEYSTSKP